MRHGKSFNHLGRTASHRQALLSNMASSLILNKRITTTVAKAKALRKYVEPIITRAKDDTTQSRRVVFSYLQDKGSVQVLFDEVAGKIADRPGGYTRIIKLAETRLGDSSEMCIMELVDYNDLMLEDATAKKGRTRRSRRGGGGSSAKAAEKPAETAEAKPAEAKEKKKEAKEEKKEAKAEGKAETKVEKPVAEQPETEQPNADEDKNKEDQK